MIYLLGVMWAAVWLGRGPAVLASVLSVASFDFFFVHPTLSFAVADTEYLMTFAVMLVAALLIGTLAARLQAQVRAARHDQRRSDALSRFSGELVALQDRQRILEAAIRHMEDVFECRVVVLLPTGEGRLEVAAGDAALLGDGAEERGVAQFAFDSCQPAGLGTATLPSSRCLHVPLRGSTCELGVIAIAPVDLSRPVGRDALRLMKAFADHAALALERDLLAEQAERSRVQSETERLRSALLSSVSHDLRTPLAAITGAASTLQENQGLAPQDRQDLLKTVGDEAGRLNRLLTNLLAMTRLESGALDVRRSWHSMEEIVGAALNRMGAQLEGRPVSVEIAHHVPLVSMDDVLIEQVVFNLLENAVKHAPSADAIEIKVRAGAEHVEVSVGDRGPGLPRGGEERLFEKFQRGDAPPAGSVGLGLAICRGIVQAHGGTIHAANRGRGALFTFRLPLGADAPAVALEAEVETPAIGARRDV